MKRNKRIQELCDRTGLQFDEATGVYRGRRGQKAAQNSYRL